MRYTLAILFGLALIGCSSPAVNNAPSDSSETDNSIPDNEKAYAWRVLDQLDRFSKIANEAQYVDNDTALAYMKSKKPTQSMLDHLKKGSVDGLALVKDMKADIVPPKFQAFHSLAVKSTQLKTDNIAGLLLAMEHNDKTEIAKVLTNIDKTAAQFKEAMDKLMAGKTAEQYLGVAP